MTLVCDAGPSRARRGPLSLSGALCFCVSAMLSSSRPFSAPGVLCPSSLDTVFDHDVLSDTCAAHRACPLHQVKFLGTHTPTRTNPVAHLYIVYGGTHMLTGVPRHQHLPTSRAQTHRQRPAGSRRQLPAGAPPTNTHEPIATMHCHRNTTIRCERKSS
jgi:hypothetical protein